jgi:hypothetical protein
MYCTVLYCTVGGQFCQKNSHRTRVYVRYHVVHRTSEIFMVHGASKGSFILLHSHLSSPYHYIYTVSLFIHSLILSKQYISLHCIALIFQRMVVKRDMGFNYYPSHTESECGDSTTTAAAPASSNVSYSSIMMRKARSMDSLHLFHFCKVSDVQSNLDNQDESVMHPSLHQVIKSKQIQ